LHSQSLRFYLNVSHKTFHSFLQSSHEEEYVYNGDYWKEDDDSFEIKVFSKFQRNAILLTLKEQSFLTTLIALYKFEFTRQHCLYESRYQFLQSKIL